MKIRSAVWPTKAVIIKKKHKKTWAKYNMDARWACVHNNNNNNNEKVLRETQTLRCLISWRWSLPSPTDPVWWKSMHTISSYPGNKPTNTHTHKQTGPITIHCVISSFWASFISLNNQQMSCAILTWFGPQDQFCLCHWWGGTIPVKKVTPHCSAEIEHYYSSCMSHLWVTTIRTFNQTSFYFFKFS